MKTVSMVLKAEAHILVEVPDDWDEHEFVNRTNPEHDALLEELAKENGAYFDVDFACTLTRHHKPAPYIWDPVKKDIVRR